MRLLLESLGHEVVGEAVDGHEAVKLAAEVRPDVAILDIRMPGRDGISAGKEILEEAICPVLLLTGFTDEEKVAAAARSGAFCYLTKPARPEEVESGIAICVQRFDDIQRVRRRLTDSKVLQRAKGLLIDRFGLSEQEAHDRIHHTARSSSRTMAGVAEEIVATQEMPG